jgi:hypothetical protein
MSRRGSWSNNLVLFLLVAVFAVALTFATVEAPRMLSRIIRERFDVPDSRNL